MYACGECKVPSGRGCYIGQEARKGWFTFLEEIHTHRIMANRLYVGGLPYESTEDQIRDAFAQAGTVVSANVIMDRMTGRSKGFGFVEMSTNEEAQAAIDMWNGKDFGGRRLTVNEARPMEERPRGNNGGGGYRGGNDRGGYNNQSSGRNW